MLLCGPMWGPRLGPHLRRKRSLALGPCRTCAEAWLLRWCRWSTGNRGVGCWCKPNRWSEVRGVLGWRLGGEHQGPSKKDLLRKRENTIETLHTGNMDF